MTQKKGNFFIFVGVLLLLHLLLIALTACVGITSENKPDVTKLEIEALETSYQTGTSNQGTIVFSATSKSSAPNYELFMVNPNGVLFSKLHDSYYGPIALDLSGRLMAVQCNYNSDSLCVLDLERSFNYLTFPYPTPSSNLDPVIRKIELPKSCRWTDQNPRYVKSIAWTRHQSLILVCSDLQDGNNAEVWIISPDGNQSIWDEQQSKDVVRILPSPVEDIFLVNSEYVNYISDQQGNRIKNLPDGRFPSWSPDGTKIAYFMIKDSPRNGLVIYDIENEEEHWIYIQPKENLGPEAFICGICCSNDKGKISWSPDGNKLVFSATHMGSSNAALFLIDINTEDITYLIPSLELLDQLGSPVWSQIDYR